MTLRIGDTAPDFSADTTIGPIRLYDWMGDDWCIMFSHPKDFTPVCSTELGQVAQLKPEFDKRNCRVIGLSADPVSDHIAWNEDIIDITGYALNYPVIGDDDLKVAKAFGMLPADEVAGPGRTVMQNQTLRTVFIIDPAKTVRLTMSYPFTCGRNFAEVLRALDSLQLTDSRKVATPSGWMPGDQVLILSSVTEEAAKTMFPQGWQAPKPYARFVGLVD